MTTTAIKERPMIFHARSIKAILANQKTMFRRVMNPQPQGPGPSHWFFDVPGGWWTCGNNVGQVWRCPAGNAGDHIWVRETWAADRCYDHLKPSDIPTSGRIYYGSELISGWHKARQPRHMPRWASRITLEITGVKVERVQSISEEDAIAEGVGHGFAMNAGWPDYLHIKNGVSELTQDTAAASFGTMWDSTNGHRKGCAWKDNPWVWALTFKVVKPEVAHG